MNNYSFDECLTGLREEFEETITEEKMELFKRLSGDINPLHNDSLYAINRGFLDRVVYGMLTTSLFSTLVGVYLPGERCLIQEINYKYVKPVYIGDTVLVAGEIVERDERTHQLMLKVRIKRVSDDATLVRGKMTVGVIGD